MQVLPVCAELLGSWCLMRFGSHFTQGTLQELAG
jgi:hypothetical protein